MLLLVCVLSHLPALDGPFQCDDQTSILENETLRGDSDGDW